ncbi:MAG: acetylxylan esterase [Victivallales bacterium]|nr:acetylxylan esterase [Victivallales bacterium]
MERRLCGNLVNEYYVRQFRQNERARAERIASLKSRQDGERYVMEVRSKIRSVFPFGQQERTPLRPRVTSSFQADGLVVDNVLFDSVPDYPVTGNFIRPLHASGRLPVALHLCGHNLTGKINDHGKELNLALASGGMAVLTIDPLDQGERMRFPDLKFSQNVRGHNQVGKLLVGCGSWFGVWRAWDAIRGLDYLLSRPEIDPERVYVIGCSGGGTMTALLNAWESRVAGAVSSCYITSWTHNVENELPADAEQIPPGLAAAGLEMADLLIAAAPRPILLSGEKDDIFDVRGSREAYEDVRKIYRLLGCERDARIFIGPNSHGLWREQQRECRQFLFELAGLPAAPAPESRLPSIPDEKLKVLTVPSVFSLPGVKTAAQRLKEELRQCEQRREPLPVSELRKRTARILGIDLDAPPVDYRILRPDVLAEPYFSRFLLEDGELPLGVLHFSRVLYHAEFPAESLLYIPHEDYRQELAEWMRDFPDCGCLSFDPLLIGEMSPSGCDLLGKEFGAVYGDVYHYSACSLLLDRPILGLMTAGILGAMKLMRQNGVRKITLIGAGQSAVPALFAAFLAPELADRTILVNALLSYAALFDVPNSICPQAMVPPGFLRVADLPEIHRAVRPELRESSALPHLTDPCR